MASRSWEKAHSPYWSLHVEAWRQSGMDRAIYCRQHGLSIKTFGRWMNHLISREEARKHAEYLLELRREERRQQRGKKGKRRQKRRYAVSTDICRKLSAFANKPAQMAGPFRERRGADRLARASSSSARPVVGTSAGQLAAESSLTAASNDVPTFPLSELGHCRKSASFMRSSSATASNEAGIGDRARAKGDCWQLLKT